MLLWSEGFDYTTATADIHKRWGGYKTQTDLWVQVIQTSNGRYSTGRGAQTYGNNIYGSVVNLGTNATTLIAGIAINFVNTLPNSTHDLFAFWDNGTEQMSVRGGSNGAFIISRNGTTLETTTNTIGTNTWHYYEFKSTFNNSTGSYEFRVDEQVWASGTNVDTQNTANAYANQFLVTGMAGICYLDDIYLCDGTGTKNNNFLGDIRVEGIFANGNGNSSQFVGSDSNSTDNYLLIDETTPNSDTDYVESATVGNKDTYSFSNVTAATGTVYGVSVMPYMKKSNAGTRKIATIARLSSTEVDGSDKILTTDYKYQNHIYEDRPTTGDWTISDVNSAEFGVKVTV